MISFQYKKVKALDKHCPATIGKEFSSKFPLDTKVEIAVFEIYHIQFFVASECLLNINLKRGNRSFEILKFSESIKPRDLVQVRNENLFIQSILNKSLQTNFSVECFTAYFLRFVPENLKIWVLGSRLGTCYQIQAFQSFS